MTEVEIYYDNDSISQDLISASTYGRGFWQSDLYHAGPVADFAADKTLIPKGCDVNFTDLSTGTPTNWEWTFTGGTPASSTVKNPVNIFYNTAGTYQVKMKAWNQSGADLKTTTSKLMRGGLLTYIIPQKILGMIEVARLLAGHYEAITVYRFPDSLYEKFKQVVVLAYKRKVFHAPTDKEVLSLQSLATTELEPIETAIEPVYELLPAPSRGANGKPIVFKRTDWEPDEVVEATIEAGVHKTSEWLDLIHPMRGLAQLSQPVMPLKKGHIAMLMASGMMGTVRLTDEAGKPMLIKGRVIKVVEKTEQPDSKEADTVVETYKDRFVTTVAVLKQDGIQVIQDVKGLSEFMKVHGEKIAAHVLETYKPLYNLDPT